MSLTIMQRVVLALREAKQEPLADELTSYIHNLVELINKKEALHKRAQEVMHEYITTVQARCRHNVWMLSPPESIACVGCGHTVCDASAFGYGKSVILQQNVFLHIGGGKFSLSGKMRKALGDKLIVKEIVREKKEAGAKPTEGSQQG